MLLHCDEKNRQQQLQQAIRHLDTLPLREQFKFVTLYQDSLMFITAMQGVLYVQQGQTTQR